MTDLLHRLRQLDAEATHIDVEAEVRYWEDATVNGVEDTNGTLIYGREGDLWKVRIRLSDGYIEGWPSGTVASIHYKVCDAGEYWLSNEHGRVAKWAGSYVPDSFLCHGDRGYGDYIIFRVGVYGHIEAYKAPEITAKDWPASVELRSLLPQIIAALEKADG